MALLKTRYCSPSSPGKITYMVRSLTSSVQPLRPIYRLWSPVMASPAYTHHQALLSFNGFYYQYFGDKWRISGQQTSVQDRNAAIKPFLEKLFQIINSFIAQCFFVNILFNFCFDSIWGNLWSWLSGRQNGSSDGWSDPDKLALESGLAP